MKIYLLRHTPVDVQPYTYYGQTDVLLKRNYLTDFISIRQSLSFNMMQKCYSSPLSRCSTLAEYLNPKNNQYDDRLKEIDFGDWEMKKIDDIELVKSMKWTENIINEPCPGGESFYDVYQRVLSFWNDIMQSNYDTSLIISHSGVIRTLLAHVLGMPLENAFILKLDYGSLSCIEIQSEVKRVLYINKQLIQKREPFI